MENLDSKIDSKWSLYVKSENIKTAIIAGSCLVSLVGGLMIDKYLLKGNGAIGITAGTFASLPLALAGHAAVNSYFKKKYDLDLEDFESD